MIPAASVDIDTTRNESKDVIGVDKTENSSSVDRQALIERIRAVSNHIREGRLPSTAPDSELVSKQVSNEDGPQPSGEPVSGSVKSGDGSGSGDGSSIDPTRLVSPAWHYGPFILIMTVLGGILGFLLALSEAPRYEAVSRLLLDPSDLRLAEAGVPPQSRSQQATPERVESQVQIVKSDLVLQDVVDNLDLANDPQFDGAVNDGGYFGLIRERINGQESISTNRNALALHILSRDVSVDRVAGTYIVAVSAITGYPDKSALIANGIVGAYVTRQREARSALFERRSAAQAGRLDELRQNVETAERRVEQFRSENDLAGTGAAVTDDQIIRLDRQLEQLRARKAEIERRADNNRQLDVDSAAPGTLPEIPEWSTIGQLRTDLAAARQTVDALATSLGPRHPRRIAAEQALSTVRSQIRNELRRIAEANEAELEQIIRSERQLVTDLEGLKSRQARIAADLALLNALEREAAAASASYDSFLKEMRETQAQQVLGAGSTRAISTATPPIKPVNPPRMIVVAGGLVLGFIAGLAISLIIGALRNRSSGSQKNTEPEQDHAPSAVDAGLVADKTAKPDGATAEPWSPGITPPPAQTDLPQRPIREPEIPAQKDGADKTRRENIQVLEATERLKRAREDARLDGTYGSNG